ncbi:hypothetical protein BCR37DRAFT_391979 [Protomyces lactucae-debilis]|uniref:SEC7 domain-containing protein n=1 Tax=Protomyces lactucae-debilis TaxID=2754530 RepID=A0A1Y2FKB6_PROLT|nr:uncharacterized protein BCR37DRAFT_391979 [Protomyces lactucae-debilis]ORY84398.1 hypothetical protein BCR37DRAFT_391979 [Protomyces lactucae-debilis]
MLSFLVSPFKVLQGTPSQSQRLPRPSTGENPSSTITARKRGFFSRVFGHATPREPSEESSISSRSLNRPASVANLFKSASSPSLQRPNSSRGLSAGRELPLINPSPPREADAELLVSSIQGDANQNDMYRLETPLISQDRFSWGDPFGGSKSYSPLLASQPTFASDAPANLEPDTVTQRDAKIHPSPTAAQGAEGPIVNLERFGPRTTSLGNLDSEYLAKAQALYDCSDASPPMEYAVFLGTDLPFNIGVRKAFLSLFDFSGLSIIKALRLLCSKLFIRGETQVLDRIIEAFADRWHQCNLEQEGRWLSKDVAYILAFALIALNTDLHVANHDGGDRKMKRSEFVQNTLTAIRAGAYRNTTRREPPRRQDSVRSSTDQSEVPLVQSTIRVVRSVSQATLDQENAQERQETARRAAELDAWRDPPKSDLSREVYIKEILLDAYTSVAREQIRQPFLQRGSESAFESPASLRMASIDGNGGQENGNMMRSMSSTSQISQLYRRSSTSRDLRHSSRQSSQQLAPATCSVGFVGTVNSVIREESQSHGDTQDDPTTGISDLLALQGPPFAKEGRLYHSLLQATTTFATLTKRSSTAPVKLKGWSSELFGVLEKGHLCLFDLTSKAPTLQADQNLGGGDWTRNARLVLEEPLNQAVAFKLSTKAYKDHAHVWSLITANGQRHAFATGTQDLVEEWVTTANYWAGRVSKEPLLGAVGSAEYGWGEQMAALLAEQESSPAVPRTASSSRSKKGAPGDHIVIQEWQPEPPSSTISSLPVTEQIVALTRFLAAIEEELKQHQAMQASLPQLLSPRTENFRRAIVNFELRDQALRKDIVKYTAYIKALRQGLRVEERLRTGKSNSSERASARSASVAPSR